MSLANALPAITLKSVFKDALPIIDKYAPTIGSVIGGVPGLALGLVVPILAKAFGSDAHNLSDIVANIVKDEAAPIKLQALEAEHCDWICSLTQSVNKLQSAEISIKLDWK